MQVIKIIVILVTKYERMAIIFMAKKLIQMNQKNKTFVEAFEDFIFN